MRPRFAALLLCAPLALAPTPVSSSRPKLDAPQVLDVRRATPAEEECAEECLEKGYAVAVTSPNDDRPVCRCVGGER